MGPTNRTASLSPDVANPAHRNVTFDELRNAFYDQARGLLDGGADLLLPETSFDTLNMKAALAAIADLFEDRGEQVPVIASVTIVDASGRTLSGQTPEAFWISVAHAPLIGLGINCSLGPDTMRPFVEELADRFQWSHGLLAERRTPQCFRRLRHDAGADGGISWRLRPPGLAQLRGRMLRDKTRPHPCHRRSRERRPPHVASEPESYSRLSGLEPLTIRPDSNFIMIGERTNVTGSRKFARLIKSEELRRSSRCRPPAGRRRRQHLGRQHGRGPSRLRQGHDDVS